LPTILVKGVCLRRVCAPVTWFSLSVILFDVVWFFSTFYLLIIQSFYNILPSKSFFCVEKPHRYRKEANDLKENFGVMVSKTGLCGILKSAGANAVTPKNIKSGFKACGIHPSAVPAEAYLPNARYTIDSH